MAQEPRTIARDAMPSEYEAGSATSPRSVEEIRRQIAHTRADLSRTIDEIQDRLRPSHLMTRTKETVKDATVGRVKKLAADNNTGLYAIVGMAATVLIVGALKWSRNGRKATRPSKAVRAGLD